MVLSCFREKMPVQERGVRHRRGCDARIRKPPLPLLRARRGNDSRGGVGCIWGCANEDYEAAAALAFWLSVSCSWNWKTWNWKHRIWALSTFPHIADQSTLNCTACGHRIAHRKWKEIKLQPGTAEPGNRLGCCLISLHFLWAILCPQAVPKCWWIWRKMHFISQRISARDSYIDLAFRSLLSPHTFIIQSSCSGFKDCVMNMLLHNNDKKLHEETSMRNSSLLPHGAKT